MRTLLKVFLTLALLLPLGAFVAGSLVASSANEPGPQRTIVIKDGNSSSPRNDASPSSNPSGVPTDGATDDHGDDGVEVLTPSPSDLDDDNHGDDHGGFDDRTGHGSGGGGDDNSGSGHSGGHDDGGHSGSGGGGDH
jgi:hypothetical protein